MVAVKLALFFDKLTVKLLVLDFNILLIHLSAKESKWTLEIHGHTLPQDGVYRHYSIRLNDASSACQISEGECSA